MLSTINELTLQKEWHNFNTNSVYWTKKVTTTTQRKGKHKHPCQSWELIPGPLASQSDALPIDH